jgi:hypothetical protein
MKTKNLFIASIIAAMFSLNLNSCKKDNSTSSTSTDEQSAVTMSTSGTTSELMYDDAFDVVNQSSEQSSLSVNTSNGTAVTNAASIRTVQSGYTTIAGATITLLPADPSVFPKTMTIDFGAGVTDANGNIRKGQMVVALTGKIRVAGSTISVTFNNYSVNSYQLTGTYAMTPVIAAGSGINYSIAVTGGSITFPNGQVSSYSGIETFTQVGGMSTASITDDTYNVTGNFSYSNTSGGAISGSITTPLVKSADCKDITSGTIAFLYKGLNGTLDFGSGTCDNIATVTVGATTKTITLAR